MKDYLPEATQGFGDYDLSLGYDSSGLYHGLFGFGESVSVWEQDQNEAGSLREEEQNLRRTENYVKLGAVDHIHMLVGSGGY